jgi:hypothetical protein
MYLAVCTCALTAKTDKIRIRVTTDRSNLGMLRCFIVKVDG